MVILNDADLAWMRGIQERAMPGTIVIERRTLAADAMGGRAETWAAVGTVVGRIMAQDVRSVSEPIAGAQVADKSRWFATMPTGTDVTATDRLFYAGRTWEVVRVNNDAMWQTAVRCEVVTYNEERRA